MEISYVNQKEFTLLFVRLSLFIFRMIFVPIVLQVEEDEKDEPENDNIQQTVLKEA
jgi:hypothetical protein